MEAAEMAAEGGAAGMEDLFDTVASSNPSLLSLVSQEEAMGSILMAAEAIVIQGNGVPKKNDHQGNAKGGGLAEMEAEEAEAAEAAEMEMEDNTAGTEKWMKDLSVGVVDTTNVIKRHLCHSPCLVSLLEPEPDQEPEDQEPQPELCQDQEPPSACTLESEPEPMPEPQPPSTCAQEPLLQPPSVLAPELEPGPQPPSMHAPDPEPPAGKLGFKGKIAKK